MGVCDVTRNTNALGCRWGTIQVVINKFEGYYEQMERDPPSATNLEDMKREALQMHMDFNDNQAFKFEHCQEIMKNNPKWCSRLLTKQGESKKHKSVNGSSGKPLLTSTMRGSGLGDDAISLEIEGENDRPEGRKTAKDKKKKLVADKGVVDMLGNMHSTWEKQYNLITEELELKNERDLKEFELKEQTMKLELEFKDRNQKLKEKAQRRKDQDRIMNTKILPTLSLLYVSITRGFELIY